MSLDTRIGSLIFVLAAAALPAPASAASMSQAFAGCRDGTDNGAGSSIGSTPALADARVVGRSGATASAEVSASGGSVGLGVLASAVGLGRESTESDSCSATASGAATSRIFIDAPSAAAVPPA